MKKISHKRLSRILSLVFSFMLVGLFAHHADAKQKSSKRSPTTSPQPRKTQTLPQASEEKLQEEKIQEEMEKYVNFAGQVPEIMIRSVYGNVVVKNR